MPLKKKQQQQQHKKQKKKHYICIDEIQSEATGL